MDSRERIGLPLFHNMDEFYREISIGMTIKITNLSDWGINASVPGTNGR